MSAADSCDFDLSTYMQGMNNFPSITVADAYQRSFYVQWAASQTIASVYFDGYPQSVSGNVYVTSTFPFDRTDPALLALSQIYPYGVFNLPTPMIGSYLVFMPDDAADASKFALREIRAWSMPDCAQQGSVVNGNAGLVGAVPANTGDYIASTNAFYIDLGSVKYLDGVWLQLGGNDNLAVSYGTTAPTNSPFVGVVTR